MDGRFPLEEYLARVKTAEDIREYGEVTQVIGLTIEANGPRASIGDICRIFTDEAGDKGIPAEVVGFRDRRLILMPLGELAGVGPGSLVEAGRGQLTVEVGDKLLGRVLDGLGRPFDGKGPLHGETHYPLQNSPPDPLERQRIKEPLPVGVRSIDGLLTCGKGQRIGIFAGSGVGKSTLLGMMARNTTADVNVIGLIGERGREVREFIERDLGPEGLARSVVIVATSDQPALIRLKGAYTATAVAEYFRDKGYDVLFMMDSVTRFAVAQREVGLAVGEPPATRGYPPSVFAVLPKLLERTGPGSTGTITALYTVLVEGDDMNEPIADTVRGILDGHIVLSRKLADRGHYPAIDVLASVSRVMPEVVSKEHLRAATQVKEMMAAYDEMEDLINIGAYRSGSNPRVDRAISLIEPIRGFLKQDIFEKSTFDDALTGLLDLTAG
ncbi:MAG TPA: flagellar protein export ATPase FliI [Firmicutes bacterium]|nr:flagellar protein export ATPase FliI [Bacillota bacterium]